MGSGKRNVKTRLEEYLSHRAAGPLTEEEWGQLRRLFASSSPSYLRRLLRRSGVALAPLVEGVRQDTFEDLERTLLALLREYEEARSAGNAGRQKQCRQAVIEAKDHARWAARRPSVSENRKAIKAEMIQWMLVWLEDPAVFPLWLKLRKKATGSTDAGPPADREEETDGIPSGPGETGT